MWRKLRTTSGRCWWHEGHSRKPQGKLFLLTPPILGKDTEPMQGNGLCFTLIDVLSGWSGNPMFSTSPWAPFKSQPCIIFPGFACHPCLRHSSPLEVSHELSGEGRLEPGQIGELCPCPLLVMLVRPIKGICATLLSLLFLSQQMRTEAQRPSLPELLPVPLWSFALKPSPLLFDPLSKPLKLTASV